jgi:Mn-containing catalase
MDGKGQFSTIQSTPLGEAPVLGPAREGSGAQAEQIGKM